MKSSRKGLGEPSQYEERNGDAHHNLCERVDPRLRIAETYVEQRGDHEERSARRDEQLTDPASRHAASRRNIQAVAPKGLGGWRPWLATLDTFRSCGRAR